MAVWALSFGLFFAILLSTLLRYNFFRGRDTSPIPGVDPETVIRALLPSNLIGNVLNEFVGLGGALALIFGALSVGSEYGWGTFKTALTQGPSRLEVYLGKTLAVLAVLLVFTLLAFAGGALSGYVIATLESAPVNWPPLPRLVQAIAAGWLILTAWGSLGVLLATLFRGTAFASGLGLLYALLLETIVAGLPVDNHVFNRIRDMLLSTNSTSLASALGVNPQARGALEPINDPAHAALVLATYVAIFVLLGALIFRYRDLA
jgi:ABC-type transport system involved in multi-copper enzyme maturation permease subunit